MKPGATLFFVIMLVANSSLEVLNFSGNQISCEGAELLSQCLRTNTKIEVLLLSMNDIKDRGGCTLAKALGMNCRLKYLGLFDNPLGEETIRRLIGDLGHNHSIQSIYLPVLWKEFAHNCNGFNETRRYFNFCNNVGR